MIKRDIAPLNKFLAKVKDASRLGLKEVRIDTRDAVEMSTLLAQILLDQHAVAQPVVPLADTRKSGYTDGGGFRS